MFAYAVHAYPHLCSNKTFGQSHSALPQEVRSVGQHELTSLGTIDMLTTRWECQGHSRAGLGLGPEDSRSKLFYELV